MKKLFIALLFITLPAWALDSYEIHINETQINAPGEFGISLGTNYLISNKYTDSRHLGYLTMEPVVGLTSWWEVAASVQFGMSQDNLGSQQRTYKVRTKLVNQPKDGDTFYQGLNVEMGYIPPQVGEEEWAVEWRPFFGARVSRLEFIFDPIVGWNFNTAQSLDFNPCMKLRYNAFKNWGYGVEYYSALGQINQLANLSDQEHTAFVFAELIDSSFDLNVGLGRGLTEASSDMVFKTLVSKYF